MAKTPAGKKKSVGAEMVAKAKITFTPDKPVAPNVKGGGFSWHVGQGVDRNQWLGVVESGVPPRIKRLDDKTFACYRDAKYLGCEGTLDAAFDRIKENKISEKNRVMKLWQDKHPDELPPGLQLSAVERAEYWKHNPPRAKAIEAARRAVPGGEDPGTARLRAELAAEAGGRPPGRGGAARRASDASDPVGTIRVRAGAAVPKKPGSAAHTRWTLLWAHDGKTVEAYRKARGNMTTLANAMQKKFVTVEEK